MNSSLTHARAILLAFVEKRHSRKFLSKPFNFLVQDTLQFLSEL